MEAIDYIIKKAKKEYNNRKIVFWGGWESSNRCREKILANLECEAEFYVTVNNSVKLIQEIDVEEKIYHISSIVGKSKEYYIIVFPKETDEMHTMFQKYGYTKEDVLYVNRKPVVVTKGNYRDEYGNEVSVLPTNARVILDGYNNKVNIGRVTCNDVLTIYCTRNASLEIKDNAQFMEKFNIAMFDLTEGEKKPSLVIGECCEMKSGSIRVYSGAVNIGDKTTFGKNIQIACSCGMKIDIGKNCMFSHDIAILSGDGHLIYDCHTRKCINSYKTLKEEKKAVIIGEHVWIGWRAMILNGANVGNGTIVGANSFLNKKTPNNVIVAGNPAVIVRRDIAWAEPPVIENIELCGEEYINLTLEEDIT